MNLSDFFAAWELFRGPTLSGVYAGMALGVLSGFIVLRRMVFLSAALSQVASFGVVIALAVSGATGIASTMPVAGFAAMILTFVVVYAIVQFRRHNEAAADVILGLAFIIGSAGTLALGSRVVEELHDVDTLLLGTAVAVVPADVTRLAILAIVVIAIVAFLHRALLATSFDRDHASVRGVPVKAVDVVLLVLIAAAIAQSTRTLGALPTFAFSVLPAVATTAVAKSPRSVLVGSAILGGVTGFTGYVAAFLWDLPVGSSYALTGSLIAAVLWCVRLVLPARK